MASIRFRSTLSFESVSGGKTTKYTKWKLAITIETYMIEKDFYIEIHPGEVLSGILEDEKISQADLSRAIGTPRKAISEICTAKRGISAEMAFKLGKALGQSADFWMTAQKNWELSQVDRSAARKVKRLVGTRAA